MYPFILTPAVKDYLWGGTRLSREYGLDGSKEKQAEGWMLSCHKDGESIIANGSLEGKKLSEVLTMYPQFSGKHAEKLDFPVLIKLIDAKDDLSVQVHPDDEYALRVEGESGKTEAWYIVDCEPGAQLIYGFKKSISKEEFRLAIENNTLLNTVNRVQVKKGDLFFIKSGTLHAIGKGILLAEIQQSSNTTYRVYDYGRLQNGKPRQLHIDKAVDVTVCEPPFSSGNPQGKKVQYDGYCSTLLVSCELFTSTCLEIQNSCCDEADDNSFVSLVILDGKGTIESCGTELLVKKGMSVFIPARSGDFKLNGEMTVLKTTV